ncbi:MAG: PRC-barrel domain-containing protein [Desulfobacteraceae bacterium]|nr:PRC-barrel domain-containing protein [Desulfobacteraceae bacterium]
MRKMALTASACVLASLLLVGGKSSLAQPANAPAAAIPGPVATPNVQGQTAAALRDTKSLIGMPVRNLQGTELGHIKSLMVDLNTGQVGYAVLASGGAAGLGREDYLVPWNALVVQPNADNLVLNVSPERLQKAPKGKEVTSYEQGRQIHLYYGCPVYWKQPLRQTQPVPTPEEAGKLEQPQQSLRPPNLVPGIPNQQ